MAHLKASIKNIKKSENRRLYRRHYLSSLKTEIKKFKAAISENAQDKVQQMVPALYKRIDKLVAKNILPKNTASRMKSSLMKKANKLAQASSSEKEKVQG